VIGKSYWSVFARPGFFQIWIEFPSVNLDLGELFSAGRCGKGRSGHSRPHPSQQFFVDPAVSAATRSGRQITRSAEFQTTRNTLGTIATRPNLCETRQFNKIDAKTLHLDRENPLRRTNPPLLWLTPKHCYEFRRSGWPLAAEEDATDRPFRAR
jgi:hypothetical protein